MRVQKKTRRLFSPTWEQPPLFFLHIPKTAGSSNNEFLKALYGPGNCHSHIENALPDLTAGRIGAVRADCVSGHVPLWCWDLYEGAHDYSRVTLFRDPWARLVSHVNWVNLFNVGMKLPKHGPGAADLARAVDLIAITDFQDRGSLLYLFDQINALRLFSSFDNYQTRMMRIGAMDAMEKRLMGADLDVACDALSSFFHYGFCEDQGRFQRSLIDRLGFHMPPKPTRVNAGRSKVLTLDNDIARAAFAPWFEMDQALVGYAKGRQSMI